MQTRQQAIHDLNLATPANYRARVGQTLDDLIQGHNALQADYAALLTQYKALLAHLDAANVAGIGNANAATYTPAASTSGQITVLGGR